MKYLQYIPCFVSSTCRYQHLHKTDTRDFSCFLPGTAQGFERDTEFRHDLVLFSYFVSHRSEEEIFFPLLPPPSSVPMVLIRTKTKHTPKPFDNGIIIFCSCQTKQDVVRQTHSTGRPLNSRRQLLISCSAARRQQRPLRNPMRNRIRWRTGL